MLDKMLFDKEKIKKMISPFLDYTLNYSVNVLYPYFITIILILILFIILLILTIINTNNQIREIKLLILRMNE